MSKNKLIVAGGGAAGFFAAINAARLNPALEVMLVEKSQKLLAKVRISGGGRCNVTHACYDERILAEKYPRGRKELRNSFHSFNAVHMVQWLAACGVALKTEADGRMFPESNSSETIINCFFTEAKKLNIAITTGKGILSFTKNESGFLLHLSDNSIERCTCLLIATGGSPSLHAYDWIQRSSGHTFLPPVPSLFTFNIPQFSLKGLEGLSVQNCKIKIAGFSFSEEGPLLITHWGLSGPAVIRLSAWTAIELHKKNYEAEIVINFLPHYHETALAELFQKQRITNPQSPIHQKMFDELPYRLWERLIELAGIANDAKWGTVSKKHQQKLIQQLLQFTCLVKGKTTYKDEFVTCGGIDLKEVNMSTMESKLIPDLYFAGEVLNIDGITGGFNFQSAWTTAMLAARNISKKTS
jgi:predicted Rossmann fold flavoprotein